MRVVITDIDNELEAIAGTSNPKELLPSNPVFLNNRKFTELVLAAKEVIRTNRKTVEIESGDYVVEVMQSPVTWEYNYHLLVYGS